VAETWVAAADIKHSMARLEVDGGQEDALAACLTGTLHYSIAVGMEFLTFQVAMGIDEFQNEK
jgi:hypothetical protein